MSVTKEFFGKDSKGNEYSLYTLAGENMRVSVTDLGACLVKILLSEENGGDGAHTFDDVILGYDDAAGYELNPPSLGAVVGPNCNRVRNAKFRIDGKEYSLPVNNGKNNLHTDQKDGLQKRKWKAETGDNFVRFEIEIPDGTYGMPGNRDFSVTYTLLESKELKYGALRIDYTGKSDADTLMNLTNHAYFNLAARGDSKENAQKVMPSVLDHELRIFADKFTPADKELIPDGSFADVKGTPFDFRSQKPIGRDIDANDRQLKTAGGYDHNFVIKRGTLAGAGTLFECADVYEQSTGRCMKVFTSLPGVQLYTSNSLEDMLGKYGTLYTRYCALCLETQFFPNAINETAFEKAGYEKPIFGPGRNYVYSTVYSFSEL